MPRTLGIVFLCIIISVFIVDICVTVATILQFNKKLQRINEISKRIHVISDQIGENIYENVTDVIEKKEKFENEHEELLTGIEEKKDELKVERERLNEKYKTMLEERKFGFERLMKAFPNMKSKENNEILITMKNIHLKSIREKIERKKKG